MKSARVFLLVSSALLLAGCGQAEHEDIQQFIRETEQSIVPKVDPLPEAKPYEPFEYTGFELPDPFKPRSLKPKATATSNLEPDPNRPREPLESYPLDSLKFVGTLEQKRNVFALIRADNVLHRVRSGNYLGQDYGQIVAISEAEVKIKERVQDGTGDWTIRESTLTLLEESDTQENK